MTELPGKGERDSEELPRQKKEWLKLSPQIMVFFHIPHLSKWPHQATSTSKQRGRSNSTHSPTPSEAKVHLCGPPPRWVPSPMAPSPDSTLSGGSFHDQSGHSIPASIPASSPHSSEGKTKATTSMRPPAFSTTEGVSNPPCARDQVQPGELRC